MAVRVSLTAAFISRLQRGKARHTITAGTGSHRFVVMGKLLEGAAEQVITMRENPSTQIP